MKRTAPLLATTIGILIGSSGCRDRPYFVGLGDLPGGAIFVSIALAISGDGVTAVGCSTSAPGDKAFSRTGAAGLVGFGDLPGGDFGS